MGYANPVVLVCLLEPGSAGDAPACITALADLVSALDAPGAIAFFARGWFYISSLIDPSRSHVPVSTLRDLISTSERPLLLAFKIPSPTLAAPQAWALPEPFGTLVLMSLLLPDGHLPLLLDHLGALFADNGRNDTSISVPAAPGKLDDPTAFPVCMAQLLVRGLFFGRGIHQGGGSG